MSKLTKRHLDYLDFIYGFWKSNNKSPTLRDIAEHFKTSISVVSYHLDTLERIGQIVPRDPGEARGIMPTELAKAIENYFETEGEKNGNITDRI